MDFETLVGWLKKFNRKERYHLMRNVVGNDRFKVSEDFRDRLKEETGITIPKKRKIYFFTDYHLDWLYAAFNCSIKKLYPEEAFKREEYEGTENGKYFTYTQEDIDLMIVFENDGINIVLIEAKYDSSFSTEQLDFKIERLQRIFTKFPTIKKHFFIAGLKKPIKLKITETNNYNWIYRDEKDTNKYRFIKLISDVDELYKIQRCDKSLNSKEEGKYFHIKETYKKEEK